MTQVLISADEHNVHVTDVFDKYGITYIQSSHSFELGDYIINGYEDESFVYGDIMVEAESVGDMWGKIKSGRGNNQLVDLSYNFRLSVLAIIGYIELDLPKQAKVEYMDYMSSVMAGVTSASWKRCGEGAEGNIAVMNFTTYTSFALYLGELAKWSEIEDPRIPKMERLSRKANWQYYFLLQTIPGVGELIAKNLIFSFPKPYDLIIATVEQVQAVEGIGKKKAQDIYDFFRNEIDPMF